MHTFIRILLDAVPYTINHFTIIHLIKYSITTKNYKIMIAVNSKLFDVWIRHNHFRISTSGSLFGLDVAKCSTHTEPSREHSHWTDDNLRRKLPTMVIDSTCHCGSLIDLTSVLQNSLFLKLLRWFMIL